jgi:hypothetical protein
MNGSVQPLLWKTETARETEVGTEIRDALYWKNLNRDS